MSEVNTNTYWEYWNGSTFVKEAFWSIPVDAYIRWSQKPTDIKLKRLYSDKSFLVIPPEIKAYLLLEGH